MLRDEEPSPAGSSSVSSVKVLQYSHNLKGHHPYRAGLRGRGILVHSYHLPASVLSAQSCRVVRRNAAGWWPEV